MIRRIAVVLAAGCAAAVVSVAPAAADHCSGKTTPPAEYSRRGQRVAVPVIGYTVQYDTNQPLVGTHYADGYIYADGTNATTNGVVVRAFIPFWPEYVDAKIIVGPGAAGSCVHPNVEYPDWLPQP